VDWAVVAAENAGDTHYDHYDHPAVYHDHARAHLAQSVVHCLQVLHWDRTHHMSDSLADSGLVEISQAIVDVDSQAICYDLAF
jgi:hypothetical protein